MDMNRNKETLVLGIGNDILMDDGIGPRLVEDLKENSPAAGVEYRTTTLGGLDILEFIQGYRTVIFIDAIKTRHGIPGTVYRFTPSDFKETLHLSNLHDISFLTAIELGKEIGLDIPREMHIIAVEIVEDLVFGESFTPQLREKYPEIAAAVKEIVRSAIGGKSPGEARP